MRRGARPIIDDAIVQALLPTNREPEAEDRELALANAPAWRTERLTPEMVRTWLRAGAHPDEAHLASALLREGITPDLADEVVTDPDTGERVTILDLARPLHRAFRHRLLAELLDAAGVERAPRPFRWWASPGA